MTPENHAHSYLAFCTLDSPNWIYTNNYLQVDPNEIPDSKFQGNIFKFHSKLWFWLWSQFLWFLKTFFLLLDLQETTAGKNVEDETFQSYSWL